MNPLIVIDPGHGGTDRDNRGPTGYVEADGVLDIGLRLRDLLKAAGYDLIMTRETDETVSLYERSEIANNHNGDLFISLHTNAGPATASGIETFYTLDNEWGNQQHHLEAKRVADYIQGELVEATGLPDRGIKTRLIENTSSPIHGKDYYSVIRRSNMPAMIIEMGFHTNPTEEALLKTEEFRQTLAEAIFKGIEKAYPLSTDPAPIEDERVELKKQKIQLEVNGDLYNVDGFFYNDRNYIQVKFLENLGYQLTWDKDRQVVRIDHK